MTYVFSNTYLYLLKLSKYEKKLQEHNSTTEINIYKTFVKPSKLESSIKI